MRYAAVSTVGGVRSENQDSVLIGSTLCVGPERVVVEGELSPAAGGALVAVIDGMGGHRGGRDASAAVGRYLLNRGALHRDRHDGEAPALDEAGDARAVHEMLTAGNCLLYDEMARRPEVRAMGATVAGLACFPAATVLYNVGDARAYRYADGYLQRVSEDHRAPAGTLLQSLGGTVEQTTLAPFVQTLPESAGRRWLLCSDGLWDFVPFLAMQEMLGRDEPGGIARQLVDAALESGSDDNVSVVVLDT
jgi:PPM family protein phosphatase